MPGAGWGKSSTAIDSLLLAYGHGCEDFDVTCCMNISNNSQSINASNKALQDDVAKLEIEDETD